MISGEDAARVGQNYQDWWNYLSQGHDPTGAVRDFLSRFVPRPAPVTAPPAPAAAPQAAVPTPAEPAPLAPPSPAPTPEKEPTPLERFKIHLADVERAIAEAEGKPDDYLAQQALPGLRTLRTTIVTQIAAEENRLRDDAKAQADKKDQPKNGDTRTIRVTTKDAQGRTVNGTATETYNNGTWSYNQGSAKADTGFLGGPEGPGTSQQIVTDGQGTYWNYDATTGKAEALAGPKAGAKTINAPDGGIYLQNPDGTPGQRLFEGLPQVYTDPDGYVVGIDRRTGQQAFRVDTKTPEGRALADRLAEAKVTQAEREAQPQFSSAVAQYTAEVGRRQSLARTELARLQDLQKQGQLAPDQAEAQFDRWMQTNVEGPLSGFKAAAEEERRTREQENLTRQAAENVRVEGLNRQRQQLGYEAGEAARRQAMDLGARTRAPQYIAGMGDFARSLAQGKTDFQFSPEAFNPANYRSVIPDYNAEADKAMQRLFGIVPQATAQNVNTPVPNLPTGADLTALMNGVRYSGPLTGTPPNEQPLPGQAAVDLGPSGQPGMARTVYPGNRYIDWAIPR